MKKVNTRHAATRRLIGTADVTALGAVRGGKLVRISDTDPSQGDGREHTDGWIKLW